MIRKMVTIYNTTLSATSQRHFSDSLGGGTSGGTSEFSFYMMENRQVPKITDKDEYKAGYHDRSRALKTSNDLNDKCSVSYTVKGGA